MKQIEAEWWETEVGQWYCMNCWAMCIQCADLCYVFRVAKHFKITWMHFMPELHRWHVFAMRLHVMQRTVLLSQFCPSVHPSVRCVYCDKTKWCTADILIPHEVAITLVFWHQQWLVGDAPFPVKYSSKVTHLLRKMPTLPHTLMFCAVQPGAYLFKLLCWPTQLVLVFLAGK